MKTHFLILPFCAILGACGSLYDQRSPELLAAEDICMPLICQMVPEFAQSRLNVDFNRIRVLDGTVHCEKSPHGVRCAQGMKWLNTISQNMQLTDLNLAQRGEIFKRCAEQMCIDNLTGDKDVEICKYKPRFSISATCLGTNLTGIQGSYIHDYEKVYE